MRYNKGDIITLGVTRKHNGYYQGRDSQWRKDEFDLFVRLPSSPVKRTTLLNLGVATAHHIAMRDALKKRKRR